MATRPYHHGNLRSTLLAQAHRTVRERGVQALSLRALAREAGVSHAAPRRHFPDRQALLDALAIDGFVRLQDAMVSALSGAGDRFADRLSAIAAAYVTFAVDDPELLELMFASKHRDPEGPLQQAAENAFGAMLEVILQGQQEGALPAGDPERVGLVLFASVHGIASLVSSGMVTETQLDELLPDAVAQFLS